MPKTKTVREIPFILIEDQFEVVPLRLGLATYPAVVRKDYGYAIRVLKGCSGNTESFDYFRTDLGGNITEAPRGYARDFKPGRIPVAELEAAVAEYAQAVR